MKFNLAFKFLLLAMLGLFISSYTQAGILPVTMSTPGGSVTESGGTSITSVSPNNGLQGQTVSVTITGSGTYWTDGSVTYVNSIVFGYQNGTATTIFPSSWWVPSQTSIQATLNLPSGLQTGLYGVTVYASTGGNASCTNCFTVNSCLPSTPGSISGPTELCQGQTVNYSISPVSGATSYTWSMPFGINASSSTTSISGFVSASYTGGNVSVVANNSCGSSSASVLSTSLGSTPSTPVISGPDAACSGTTVTYSVAADPNASSYSWTLPTGMTGSSTSNSITASVSGTFSGGTVSVTATGSCGTSAAGTLSVSADQSAPVLNAPVLIDQISLEVSWSQVSNAEGYEIQGRKVGSASWKTKQKIGVSNTTQTYENVLSPGTCYEFRVRSYSSACGFSSWVGPDTVCTDTLIDYCGPISMNTTCEFIQDIKIGAASVVTGNNGGYFSPSKVNVVPVGTYPVVLRPGFQANCGTPPYVERWRIFVDLNGDGILDSSEILLDTASSAKVTSSITIPGTATSGISILRVQMIWDGYNFPIDPCDDDTDGEVEDYYIKITGGGGARFADIDLSGSEEIASDKSFDFLLYPNPSNGMTNLSLELTEERSDLNILVFNMQGQMVHEMNMKNVDAGVFNYQIPELELGVYNVIVRSDRNTSSNKLVIMK